MTQKCGQALGIFLVGQLVAYVGLSDRVRPEDWPEATARTLAWIFAGLLILIAILAAAGLRRYSIDRASPAARLAADRKSTRLNSSHSCAHRMPSSSS